jgi:ATP-dependent 26S proteasome regulatory subunit
VSSSLPLPTNLQILDPAILRRPGRFDRVVHFPNLTAELRLEYSRRINGVIGSDRLQPPVEESLGFSFAQLRESYIIAGQFAFERGDAIGEDDLLTGIRALQKGNVTSSRHGGAPGFRSTGGGAA